jgi:F-type H+-transporting ATPase subunit b
MLIDWFTVAAQAVNFLILAWLLKRFLYGPILRAIDQREKRIASELQQASAKMEEAKKEETEFRRKKDDLDRRSRELLGRAAEEAGTERRRLLEEARKEIAGRRSQWEEALQSDQRRQRQEVADRISQEVFATARKVLGDLAGESLEERMTQAFLERLSQSSPAEKEPLCSAAKNPDRPLLVRSAFDLPLSARKAIEEGVRKALSPQARITFEVAPELIAGIELAGNGYKVAWSVADALASMQKKAGALLEKDDDAG